MAETDKAAAPTESVAASTPGTVIVPSGAPREADKRTTVLPKPAPPPPLAAAPTPPNHPVPPSPAAETPPPNPAPPAQHPTPPQPAALAHDNRAPAADTSAEEDGTISWTAAEFIAHDKTARWYGLLLLSAALSAGLVLLLTRDIISTSVVLVGAIILAIYAARQPKQQTYQANINGISVGQRYHSYEEFRSFAVTSEGGLTSIVFMPLKRFSPLTTVYCKPGDEDQIIDLFADILPFEEHTYDAFDRLMQRIRF